MKYLTEEGQKIIDEARATGDAGLIELVENSALYSLEALREEIEAYLSRHSLKQEGNVVKVSDPYDGSAVCALDEHDREL